MSLAVEIADEVKRNIEILENIGGATMAYHGVLKEVREMLKDSLIKHHGTREATTARKIVKPITELFGLEWQGS